MFGPETYIVLGVALFLFLLVPALNLSGLNASRMQDRVSELGVRKAFGASRKTLMGQVFWENMLLMLPGAWRDCCSRTCWCPYSGASFFPRFA